MFMMIFFAIGIARSRELLGLRGGGLLDLSRKPRGRRACSLIRRSRANPRRPR
jgi:hypothetical protein